MDFKRSTAMISPAAIIRAYFSAYESKDRAAIEGLIAEDFTFTSPLDDNISRERYFERCWPNSEHIESIRIENIFAQADEAFVQYELHSKGKPPFRNTEFFKLRDGKVTHVDVYFGAETGEGAAQEEIRAVLEARAEAIRHKDVDGAVAHFAPNAVRFSLAPPLEVEEPIKEELSGWFATFRGDIGCEMRDLSITAAGDLACSHSLSHLTGTKTDGEKVDVWFRETLCLRPIDGRWRIIHDHESVPFYMDGSFKAALDLKPA
jgi:ketosteroid isomerase-like protein